MAASNITSPYACESPAVGATDYIQKLDRLAQTVDAHDHSANKGLPVERVGSGVADNSTIEVSSNQLRVKALGIAASHVAANAITGAKLNSNVVDNSTLQYTSSQLSVKPSGITEYQLAGKDIIFSSGGSVSITSTSESSVDSVTVPALGKALRIELVGSFVMISTAIVTNIGDANYGFFSLYRGATLIATFPMTGPTPTSSQQQWLKLPPSAISFVDITPGTGNVTYTLKAAVDFSGPTISTFGCRMMVSQA